MICVTGDLHHMSLRTNEQRCLRGGQTEVRTALAYLEIAFRYNVLVTLFITGRAFLEEWIDVKEILAFPNVEIGGHTFNAFSPKILHRVYKQLFGTYNGPVPIQRRDIRRTIDIIQDRTKQQVLSWRDHAYIHDRYTYLLLRQNGIRVVSDDVNPSALGPIGLSDGMIQLPINVMPDHEHLLHAHRTEELQRRIHERYGWSDAFGWQAYPPDQWLDRVISQADRIDVQGGVATVLMHPLCMYTANRFASFETFCRFAAERHTIFPSEAIAHVDKVVECIHA